MKRLLYKFRRWLFCRSNGYNCPDCIYHEYIWDGLIFRGIRCHYPLTTSKTKAEGVKE